MQNSETIRLSTEGFLVTLALRDIQHSEDQPGGRIANDDRVAVRHDVKSMAILMQNTEFKRGNFFMLGSTIYFSTYSLILLVTCIKESRVPPDEFSGLVQGFLVAPQPRAGQIDRLFHLTLRG